MAKLYFRFGTVSCGKTLALVNVVQTYRLQGKSCLVLKPQIDTRYGEQQVRSRTGLSVKADHVIKEPSDIPRLEPRQVDLILVDEAQFLSVEVIDALRRVTIDQDIPTLCFGLRTDFRGLFFEGSRRLFEVADSLEEFKSICHHCDAKAIHNLRLHRGQPVFVGAVVKLGENELYQPVCSAHFLAFRDRASAAQKKDGTTLTPKKGTKNSHAVEVQS